MIVVSAASHALPLNERLEATAPLQEQLSEQDAYVISP